MTRAQRVRIAMALLRARPPTIPGTRVIPDERQRMVWYNCVTEVGMAVCADMASGTARGKAYSHFCDVAGVPE